MSEKKMKKHRIVLGLVLGFFAAGCVGGEVRPVDIFPEDLCAGCRMAISDTRFASEIMTTDGTVHKYDDIGCLLHARQKMLAHEIAAIFVKDYETLAWVPYGQSTIVSAGIHTPMASGRIAFASADRAAAFVKAHPPEEKTGENCEACTE